MNYIRYKNIFEEALLNTNILEYLGNIFKRRESKSLDIKIFLKGKIM